MTNNEVLALALARQRGGKEPGVNVKARHPVIGFVQVYLTSDADGTVVTVHRDDGDYLTESGWKTEDELGLYDQDGDLVEDADLPEITWDGFRQFFGNIDWKLASV